MSRNSSFHVSKRMLEINSGFPKGDFEKTNSAKSNILLMLSISGMCKNIEIPTIYAPKRCPICSPCLNAVLSGLHTRPLGSVGRVKLGGRTRTFQAHRFGRHVCVLESASGIKQHDAIGRFEESCREQMIVRGSGGSSFGR